MANALTYAQLEQARAMITAGNLIGFYEYMETQGYNYAYRAEGIIKQDTLAGTEALNYLELSAQSQGVTLNSTQIGQIETQLAGAWVTALEAVANANHTVSADLSFRQTLAFHTAVFSNFNINPTAWTLDIPSKILSASDMEQTWEGFLNVSPASVANDVHEGVLESQLVAKMAFYAEGIDFLPPNPALQSQARQWLANTVGQVVPDFAIMVGGKVSDAENTQLGQSLGDLLLYGEQAGSDSLTYLNSVVNSFGAGLSQATGESIHLGQNVNLSNLANQLTESEIPLASTQAAAGSDATGIADAAANATARQQLYNQWYATVQGLTVAGNVSTADLITVDAQGNKTDTQQGWNVTADTDYQQVTTTSSGGAVKVAIDGDGDSAVLANNATAIITGDGDTVAFSGNGSVTVTGENNNFTAGSLKVAAGNFISQLFAVSSSSFATGLSTDNGIANVQLGNLVLGTATGGGTLTLTDGLVIHLPSTLAVSLNDAASTPEQALLGYLSGLNDPLTAAALDSLNYSYLNPTGTAYTVVGGMDTYGDKNAYFYLAPYAAPGAVIAGIAGYTNILSATNTDLSRDTVTGVQTLYETGTIELTGAQFNGLTSITGQSDTNSFTNATLVITTAGSYALSANDTDVINSIAQDWLGTTLTGNAQASQGLFASVYGNDTLHAGSGAGDSLWAGEGVDTLLGNAAGGDVFIANTGLAGGSKIIGLGTGNVLAAQGDISGATISGVGALVTDAIALTAAEWAGFSSVTGNGSSELRLMEAENDNFMKTDWLKTG